MTIQTFRSFEWCTLEDRGDIAMVHCDRERPRIGDFGGLVGATVDIDGVLYVVRSAESRASGDVIRKGEHLALIVRPAFPAQSPAPRQTGRLTLAELLTTIGRALFGERWKADMAHALEVRVDRIDDWVKGRGKEPPPGVWEELAGMLHDRELAIPVLKAAALEQSGLPLARVYKHGQGFFRVEAATDGRYPRVRAIGHKGWSQYVDDVRRLPDDTRFVVLEFDGVDGQPFEVRRDGYVSYPKNMKRVPLEHASE